MWNHPQADDHSPSTPPQPPQPGAPGDSYAEITWSQEQLGRMENEWRRLQRAFAYHPHVTLTPLTGDPPAAYQVDFRLTTVIVNPRTSQLEYVANAAVQILLPPGFPHDSPVVKPLTAIFHPNVSYEGLFIEGLWHPNETLLGLIRKVGDVLAYRSYDPDYAVNPAAMEWLIANHAILPIDQQANLSPQAGGEPLDRICRYGPQSLEAMKQSVVATQSALFGNSAPDLPTLRSYATKTRMALNLFTENDVPEHLQSVAGELDEAARELMSMAPLYDFVRDRRRRVGELRQAVKQLSAVRQPLMAELDKLSALSTAEEPLEPMAALKLIPPADKLQPLQFSMPRLIDDAEKKFAAIKRGLESLAKLQPPALVPTDSLLGRKLDRELTVGEAEAGAAVKESEAVLKESEPLLNRAGSEATALDFAVRWREYLDMADKARLIERRIKEWGSEGLQAYFIENAGGHYGPFQFEQSVDLGGGEMLIRNNGGKLLELWDHKRDKPLVSNPNGVMLVALPAPTDPNEQVQVDEHGRPIKHTIPTKFTMTERCDDLVVLLEFLRRSAIETVKKFAAYNGDAQSWAGKVCRILSEPEVNKAMEEELARAARRWRHLIVDLAALSPWKERLATYFLLTRAASAVPQLVAEIEEAKKTHVGSKSRVNDIMSKSGRDIETGSMIVPPKYSKQYQQELKLQDQCATTVKVATGRLRSLVGQLTVRLQNPKRLGKGTLPQMRAVAPLPPALAALPLADGQIGHLIVPLEELLQKPLGGPRPEFFATPVSEEYDDQGEVDAQAAGAYAAEGDAPAGEYVEYAEGTYEQTQYQQEQNEHYAGEGYGETATEAAETSPQAQPEYPPAAPAEVAEMPTPPDAVAEAGVADDAEISAAYEATGTPQDVATDEWIIQEDDEESIVTDDSIESSDIAFGFDPEPGQARQD